PGDRALVRRARIAPGLEVGDRSAARTELAHALRAFEGEHVGATDVAERGKRHGAERERGGYGMTGADGACVTIRRLEVSEYGTDAIGAFVLERGIDLHEPEPARGVSQVHARDVEDVLAAHRRRIAQLHVEEGAASRRDKRADAVVGPIQADLGAA